MRDEYDKSCGLEPSSSRVVTTDLTPEADEHSITTGFSLAKDVAEFLGTTADPGTAALKAELQQRWKLVERVNQLEEADKDDTG